MDGPDDRAIRVRLVSHNRSGTRSLPSGIHDGQVTVEQSRDVGCPCQHEHKEQEEERELEQRLPLLSTPFRSHAFARSMLLSAPRFVGAHLIALTFLPELSATRTVGNLSHSPPCAAETSSLEVLRFDALGRERGQVQARAGCFDNRGQERVPIFHTNADVVGIKQ